jgi:ribosome-binding protein aMBF1 (putative translation factor)
MQRETQAPHVAIPTLKAADVAAVRKEVSNLRRYLSAFGEQLDAAQFVRLVRFDREKMSKGRGGAGELLAAATESPEGVRGYVVQHLLNGFGDFVRRQRTARGWTLDELAEKSGTTAPMISLIERGMGKRGPSLEMVARLLLAFDLELDFGSAQASDATSAEAAPTTGVEPT